MAIFETLAGVLRYSSTFPCARIAQALHGGYLIVLE